MSASYLQYCPEGWQCVPKTVTPEMAEAYASDAYDTAQQCHDAMLGVAPHPGDADEVISSKPTTNLARRDYEVMNKIREGMEQERDALAAHVERLNKVFSIADGWYCAQSQGNYGEAKEWLRHLSNHMGNTAPLDTPSIDLTKRDLIKQAEALEKIYSESQGCMIINRGSLLDESRVLRQRAQELTE